MSEANEILDVAIVGGGVSGVYTGYRLLGDKRCEQRKITVYEMSHRIGGRLLSVRAPGVPSVVCELGGMRYLSTQPLVRSLVEEELKLKTKPQAVDEPENLVYLRGSRLRHDQLTDASKLPYKLEWNEKDKDPSSLLGYALTQIFPQISGLAGAELRETLEACELDGKPLFQHGFWNVVARAMSREAYSLSCTTVGYDVLGANGNAVDLAFEYCDFTPGTKYNLLVEGYETVPRELADRFQKLGGHIELGKRLKSFDRAKLPDGTEGVVLRFANHPDVYAKAIVLAMPQRSIRLLDPTGPVLDPSNRDVQDLIDSVFAVPLYKMFLAYPFPFWESVGVKQGRSLTDLTVRQCYYWAVEGDQPGADPKNRNALLMSYDDLSNVQFWGGLRKLPLDGPPKRHAPPTPLFKQRAVKFALLHEHDEPPVVDSWDDHVAPEIMVEEMHRQLVEMHGVKYAPEPYAAAYRDWSDDPFGGGVHLWNIGYRSTDAMNQMTKPRDDFPCYVTGEAYSQGQTWVEGALQTAELVLQRHFGLAPPPWLKKPAPEPEAP